MSADNQQERPNYVLTYRDESADYSLRGEHRFYSKDDQEARQRADSFIESSNATHRTLVKMSRLASDDWRQFTFLELKKVS